MHTLPDLSPTVATGVALLIYLVGLVAAFGVRAWVQLRRTGDAGVRRIRSDEHPLGRAGAVLFLVSLMLTGAGLVAPLLVPGLRLDAPALVVWCGLALALLGLLAVLVSQAAMGASWRVGVDPDERTALVTDGPFAVVRNPIFSAMGVTLAGVGLMVPGVVVLVAVVTFAVGVQLQVRLVEEPYLRRVHGDDYDRYAARVGRFVPGVGRLR